MPELFLPSLFITSKQKGRDTRTMTLNLQRGLFFPEYERIYCRVTSASIPYSFITISQELYNNATYFIEIDNGGGGFASGQLTLPEGVYYSVTEIVLEMDTQIRALIAAAVGPPPTPPAGSLIIDLEGITTQQVIQLTIDRLTIYDKVTINFTGALGGGGTSLLYQELGLDTTDYVNDTSVGDPEVKTFLSTNPVLLNDRVASGVYIVVEGDLSALTYKDDVPNRNIVGQIIPTSQDEIGSMIDYPKSRIPIDCPIVGGKTIDSFNVRFVSPIDNSDIYFLQGNASIVLSFIANYNVDN